MKTNKIILLFLLLISGALHATGRFSVQAMAWAKANTPLSGLKLYLQNETTSPMTITNQIATDSNYNKVFTLAPKATVVNNIKGTSSFGPNDKLLFHSEGGQPQPLVMQSPTRTIYVYIVIAANTESITTVYAYDKNGIEKIVPLPTVSLAPAKMDARYLVKHFTVPSPGGAPTVKDMNVSTTLDSVLNKNLQHLIEEKSDKHLPFILAVVITMDTNGQPAYHYYDASTIMAAYKKTPDLNKNTSRYNMTEPASHQALFPGTIFFYTLDKMNDVNFTFLCSDTEALLAHGEGASSFAPLFTAYAANNAANYKTAYQAVPKEIIAAHPLPHNKSDPMAQYAIKHLQIPAGANTSPISKTVDTSHERDAVEVDDFFSLIQEKLAHGIPYIFCVVQTGPTAYHYYDASSVLQLYDRTPGRMLNNSTYYTYNMIEPMSRQEVLNVYFYTLDKITDPNFKLLCTADQALVWPRASNTPYERLLRAYTANNKATFTAALDQIHAPGQH